jgi:hypothetical protein
MPHSCSHKVKNRTRKITSLDSWEELLDNPENLGRDNVGIVRAYNNLLARLAATCINIQKGLRTVLFPSRPACCQCCFETPWRWQRAEKTTPNVVTITEGTASSKSKADASSRGSRDRQLGDPLPRSNDSDSDSFNLSDFSDLSDSSSSADSTDTIVHDSGEDPSATWLGSTRHNLRRSMTQQEGTLLTEIIIY